MPSFDIEGHHVFCPVRDFAAAQGVDEQTALSKGMKQKSEEFVQRGSQLYSKD